MTDKKKRKRQTGKPRDRKEVRRRPHEARRAKSPEEREMITIMAKTWRMLADQREKRILNQSRDEITKE